MDSFLYYFHCSNGGMVFQASQKQFIEHIEPISNWIPEVDSITQDMGEVSCKLVSYVVTNVCA